ncbi:MAG: hypothetical protein K2L15_00720 [Eubacteriales bacterium]|nr:hypothetical protein [Eubacteriales bacterium]
MSNIELITSFRDYVDEMFTTESKRSLITNQDFNFVNAKTVKVYKVSTAKMNDYNRDGELNGSRYGKIQTLDATTEIMTLRKDRSFTFEIDKLDQEETANVLESGKALARQLREVAIPEIDKYTYNVMCENAGTIVVSTLSATNVYSAILDATNVLDDNEVPETNRFLLVTPDTYLLMKKSKEITMDTDIGNELRLKGVIGIVDGMQVIKVPKGKLPDNTGFLVAHPSATVNPVKLEEYKVHKEPQGISGSLVEGRLCYDAFVLDNKVKAIYLHKISQNE